MKPKPTQREKREFRASVQSALAKKGWRLSDLARRVRRSRNATSRTVNHLTFPGVEVLIRKALKL